MKCLNPLQKLIDELNQEKKLHAQLAKNAENECQSVENGYADFEKGVAYGFELAIEILAKFQFWNDARTNPPKFDERRECPSRPHFICVNQDFYGAYYVSSRPYDFDENDWLSLDEVVYWQEYSIKPKELLIWKNNNGTA